MKIKSAFSRALFGMSLVAPVAYADQEIQMIIIPGKNFELGKYEVTQRQWKDVMGNNPSSLSSCGDNCPVDSVSWNDTQAFIRKLNVKTGKQYRLPSEDEWEYACYGGIEGKYCGGNDLDALAWYGFNSSGKTHAVGLKRPNGYGLYDMTGNVWEWVADRYDSQSDRRVLRGGSWGHVAPYVGAANRGSVDPAWRYIYYGFRLARTLP